MQIHPNLAQVPELSGEELDHLTASIRERGQLEPVVLAPDGAVLDGRARLAACKTLGRTPATTVYRGDDPAGYATTVNLDRRTLTKGQRAMLAVRTGLHPDEPAASTELDLQPTRARLALQAGVSPSRISFATTVLRRAPDLVPAVIAGTIGLNEAYKTALKRKYEAQALDIRLRELQKENPELAERVALGELTVAGAYADHQERLKHEADARRRVTSHLGQFLVAVSQLGTRPETYEQYDPENALPGRKVTSHTITKAQAALEIMAMVWDKHGW